MPAPPFSTGSVRNRFRVPGTPTSIPTYTKIAIAPNTKWRNFKAPFINVLIGSVVVATFGSGIRTNKSTKNAKANTAIAVYITGKIWEIVAFSIEPAIRIPTNIGVMVAITELKEPPTWISWLPLLPSPPNLFNIGFTTVLSKHIEKPATNAPIK